VRNNMSEPTLGHVIMFAASAVGWLVLFLVNLTFSAPGAGWWIRAVFSGVLLIVSTVLAIMLWRRLAKSKAG
jgi:hypothetical protein